MPDLSPAPSRAKFRAALCLLLCALTSTALARQTQQPTPVLQLGHNPEALALSPDGRFAVTGSYGDGSLKWWDSRTGLLMRSVVAHDGMIGTVSFDAGGGRVLSGGADGFIKLWDAASARKLLEFRVTTGMVEYAAMSPRGDLIASCSYGFSDKTEKEASATVRLWDARTGAHVNTLRGHTGRVLRLAFNPAGDTLVSSSEDKSLKVWSVATGTLLRTIPLAGSDGFVSFGPDGETIAATTSARDPTVSEIHFFNARTGARLRGFIDYDPWAAKALTPDWRFLITSGGQTFKVWDAAGGRLLRTARREGDKYYLSAAVDAGGSTLAFGGGTSPLFLPSSTLSSSQPEAPVLIFTTGLAANRARGLVAWGAGNEVYVWDAASARLLYVLQGHQQWVNEVAFSPDGRTLASCTNNEVKLWSTSDGALLGDLKTPRMRSTSEYDWDGSQSVSFSPDGTLLATGELGVMKSQGDEYTEVLGIRLWDLRTRRLLKYFKLPDYASSGMVEEAADKYDKGVPFWVRTIAFSPDGKTIASDNGSERVLLLNVTTGRFRSLEGHTSQVNSVAFSADGKRLVSASFDKTVKVWDVATGRALRTLRGHTNRVTTARFSPDGRVVISGGLDRTVRLWDASGGAPLSVLANHEEPVTSATVGPDGRTFFTTGMDGRVSLWSLPGRSLAATLLADSDGTWVCLSPDGYYKGNDAEKYLGWRVGDEMYPASAYREQFAKPDTLLARLNWKPEEPPEPRAMPTPVAAVRPTPTPIARPTPTPTPTATPTVERGAAARPVSIPVLFPSGKTHTVEVYKGSYALVIGNSEYSNWTKLPGVYQDLNEVAGALSRQGFNVVSFDEGGKPVSGRTVKNLTRAEFNRQLELFVNEYGQDEENRLLIYYAGHGYTALLPDGRKMGYLVMRDAPVMPPAEYALERGLNYQQVAPFRRTSVNMDEIETFAKNITARHALFVFDSCFAGTVLFRDGEVAVPGYISEEVTQSVREFLTAGNERQRVSDDSAFRKAFVRGIEGAADSEDRDHKKDGYVLASELYQYIRREVSLYTGGKQTPVFGKILKQELARGDFVFVYPVTDR